MLRKRNLIGALLLVIVALSLGVWASVASASSTTNLNVSLQGHYSCFGSCATATSFRADGSAHSDSPRFGAMHFSLLGTILEVNAKGCLVQSETWTLTTPNGHIFMSTTSDLFCPTADPNAFAETATFNITGGAGSFSGATGAGTFMLTVLGNPQTASGTLHLKITY
jgi:hypothetical protein